MLLRPTYIFILSLNVAAFALVWSGDPEIHIIFAQNFLNGDFLSFNPPDKDTGETSIIYMLLLSALLYVTDFAYAPLVIKFTNIIVSLLLFVYFLRKSRPALVIFLLPTVIFQISLGMETILYCAFMIVAYTQLRGICDAQKPPNVISIICIVVLAVLGFFLRPEFVLYPFFAATVLLLHFKTQGLKSHAIVPLLSFGVIFFVWYLIEQYTGQPLHGAGEIRKVNSMTNKPSLSFYGIGIPFEPRILIYFVLTLPIFLMARNIITKIDLFDIVFTFFFIIIPLFAYTFFFLPTTHITRYLLDEVIITYFVLGRYLNPIKFLNYSYLIALSLVITIDFSARYISGHTTFTNPYHKITRLLSPYQENFSDRNSVAFCKQLRDHCENDNLPVVVAVQEVQMRLRLDDHFTIASLDGITDFATHKHFSEGYLDIDNFADELEVDVFLEYPRYLTRDLQSVKVGEVISIGSACFEKTELNPAMYIYEENFETMLVKVDQKC